MRTTPEEVARMKENFIHICKPLQERTRKIMSLGRPEVLVSLSDNVPAKISYKVSSDDFRELLEINRHFQDHIYPMFKDVLGLNNSIFIDLKNISGD